MKKWVRWSGPRVSCDKRCTRMSLLHAVPGSSIHIQQAVRARLEQKAANTKIKLGGLKAATERALARRARMSHTFLNVFYAASSVPRSMPQRHQQQQQQTTRTNS